VNAERYTTPELRDYERKVLDADETNREIERGCSSNCVCGSENRPHGFAGRPRLFLSSMCSEISRDWLFEEHVRPEFSDDAQI